MPEYSTRRANNFMCLSILLGNLLILGIYVVAGFAEVITGNTQMLDLLQHPVALVAVAQVCIGLIPFLVYLGYTGQRISDVLPLKGLSFINIFLITLITITIMPLANLVGAITSMFFENNIVDTMTDINRVGLGISILTIGVMPAIFEEITMRGIILSNYKHIDIRKAALVNGFFFGIFHMNPFQFFYAFILGYLFALFVFYTGSILSAIYAHFIFNTIQLLLLHVVMLMPEVVDEAVVVEEPDMIVTIITLAIVATIFTFVSVVLFKSFKGINRKRKLNEELSMQKRMRRLSAMEEKELHVRDAGRLNEIARLEGSSNPEESTHEGQRIITPGFVWTIVVYLVVVFLLVL